VGLLAWFKLDVEDFRFMFSETLAFTGLVVMALGFSTVLWIAHDGISPLETTRKT
jgi:hypothetical protein